MAQEISFFKFHPDINVAQNLDESPNALNRYTPQIQLVPFDKKPYTQVTNSELPLSFGNTYKVYLVNAITGKQTECTDHIFLTSDVLNQIKIKIAYLLWDFSTVPVYFKIDRYGDGLKNYYSNKFLLTEENKELTSRIDYVDKNVISVSSLPQGTFYQSIRLQFYFNNFISATDIDTYYQISTSQVVNPRISVKEYSSWITQLFNAWTFKRLARALYTGKCYINQYRNFPTEVEYQEREAQSNISESKFITDQDDKDFLNIADVIILPDYQQVPFLASSSQLSSSSFLISQSIISIPIP